MWTILLIWSKIIVIIRWLSKKVWITTFWDGLWPRTISSSRNDTTTRSRRRADLWSARSIRSPSLPPTSSTCRHLTPKRQSCFDQIIWMMYPSDTVVQVIHPSTPNLREIANQVCEAPSQRHHKQASTKTTWHPRASWRSSATITGQNLRINSQAKPILDPKTSTVAIKRNTAKIYDPWLTQHTFIIRMYTI